MQEAPLAHVQPVLLLQQLSPVLFHSLLQHWLHGTVVSVVHYCAVRKKSKCHKFYSLTIARKQQKQQPAPVYEDIVAQKGTVDPTHIELRENIAYGSVQNWLNLFFVMKVGVFI